MRDITLLDGASGTSLWERTGDHSPVWMFNLNRPDDVRAQILEFIETGARIVMSNTFGANGPAVKASSDMDPDEVVAAGVRLAKEALSEAKAKVGDGRYDAVKVALAVGPLTQMLEPWGELSHEDCRTIYEKMIEAGMREGADIIYPMTFMDLDMLRIAVEVASRFSVPVFASMSFTEFGKTIMGNGVEDIVAALVPLGVAALGINCSLGPDKALPILREFAFKSPVPTIFKPNAGIPILSGNHTTTVLCTPENFAKAFIPALQYADYVGGCCGTNATYLAAIRDVLEAGESSINHS